MRFYLNSHGTEAEISVAPTQAAESGRCETVSTEMSSGDERSQRCFLWSCGAALELQADGSYKRHAINFKGFNPHRSTFFYAGRVRVVDSVGGIGGRVESHQSEGTVGAPMNGQVVKVAKMVGDLIESGDIVLILEAMKMENEVTAPLSGILTELLVEPGQNVGPGQLLFSVEAAK